MALQGSSPAGDSGDGPEFQRPFARNSAKENHRGRHVAGLTTSFGKFFHCGIIS